MPKKVFLDIDILKNLYLNFKKGTVEIANIFNCNSSTILRRLKKFNIPIRTNSEAHINLKVHLIHRADCKCLPCKFYRLECNGEKHPRYKGKYKSSEGYIFIYNPKHPSITTKPYVQEHRLVMEKHIGRYLESEEVVHHKNGITDDNRIENLELLLNQSKHSKLHFLGRKRHWKTKKLL